MKLVVFIQILGGGGVRMKRIILFTVFFLFLMTRIVTAANCGGATPCQCGDTLTSSYTMTSDLTCIGYTHGIIIGASNIVLDCQGYKISNVGVNYEIGIWLNGVSGNVIENCVISGFVAGIRLDSSSSNTIINNTAGPTPGAGINLVSSSSNTIINNTANSNGGGGIGLLSSSSNTIINNTANSNGWYSSKNGNGIILSQSSNNNIITSNTANSNDGSGITLGESSNNTITSNTANSNYYNGIWLYPSSNNNIITSNTANSNDIGISLADSSNNTLTSNTFNSNNHYGIKLSWYSNNNSLTNNTANSNYYNGIDLEYSSNNNIITSNTANSNDGSGITLLYSSSSNLIYNNYFNNSVNVWEWGNNFWNTTKTPGTNIIGGDWIGGNYWSDFATNPLCIPNRWYNIPGYGNGIDYHPLNTEPCQVITTTTTTTTSTTTTSSTTTTTTTTTTSTTTITTTSSTTTTSSSSTTSTSTTTTIRRGGGGCPILKVYQNNKLVTIEKLNIHSPKNQDVIVTSTFTMEPINGKYEIILDEAAYLFWDGSHINSVKLTDETGKECKLISATHSKQGDVLSAITTSDDVRVRSYPGERIKLTYDECSGNQFTFSIEGYNVKTMCGWVGGSCT